MCVVVFVQAFGCLCFWLSECGRCVSLYIKVSKKMCYSRLSSPSRLRAVKWQWCCMPDIEAQEASTCERETGTEMERDPYCLSQSSGPWLHVSHLTWQWVHVTYKQGCSYVAKIKLITVWLTLLYTWYFYWILNISCSYCILLIILMHWSGNCWFTEEGLLPKHLIVY